MNGSRNLGLIGLCSLFLGCATEGHYLVTTTGTIIGVDVSKEATSDAPSATLGYKRTEVAVVPTNRRICSIKDSDQSIQCESGEIQGGALDTGEVLLELRYGGIFDLGASSGIYQRLAVGKEAVKQPGAAFMFARDGNSEISDEAAESVAEAVEAQASIVELEPRIAEGLELGRQERVDQLLTAIESIDDNSAISLNENPPVVENDVESVVALRDPTDQRFSNGDVAREMLKMRAVLNQRDDTNMELWEAAVQAAQ